eukprot:767583-Hanusia_phi.AAC.3
MATMDRNVLDAQVMAKRGDEKEEEGMESWRRGSERKPGRVGERRRRRRSRRYSKEGEEGEEESQREGVGRIAVPLNMECGACQRQPEVGGQWREGKRLVESGWRDDLKEYCKGVCDLCCVETLMVDAAEVIKDKYREDLSVDELVSEITPRGYATIPDEVKAELLERIRKFLAAN